MYTPGKKYNLFDLLQKADEGDLDAMATVVSLLDVEGYSDDDPDGEIAGRQISYLSELVAAEWTPAYIMLGEAFLEGKGISKDSDEAISWFKKAADCGITFGNECIGMMYFEGKGVPVDYQKAYEYFTRDECWKSYCTTYSLGEMYRQGLYVSQDDVRACDYYSSIVYDDRLYAEMDDYYWRACYRLGVAFHNGHGVEKDLKQALELLSRAKSLYESRGEKAVCDAGISKEDLYQEWHLLNQDAGQL